MVNVRGAGRDNVCSACQKAEIFAGFSYGAVVGAIPVPTC